MFKSKQIIVILVIITILVMVSLIAIVTSINTDPWKGNIILTDISSFSSHGEMSFLSGGSIFFLSSEGYPKKLDLANTYPITNYTWSTDGKYLAYVHSNGVAIVSTKNYTSNVTLNIGNAQEPSWSPDSSKLALIIDKNLCITYLNDFHNSCIKDVDASRPRWSPDGTWIAFEARTKWSSDVLIVHVDSLKVRLIASNASDVAWSPNSRYLAYAATLDEQPDPDLYMTDLVTQLHTRLTATWGIETAPSWSPDGRLIAFKYKQPQNVTVNRNFASYEIHLIDINTSKRTRLTNSRMDVVVDEAIAWSPDSELIAFSVWPSYPKSVDENIYVIDIKNMKMMLATPDADARHPAWVKIASDS